MPARGPSGRGRGAARPRPAGAADDRRTDLPRGRHRRGRAGCGARHRVARACHAADAAAQPDERLRRGAGSARDRVRLAGHAARPRQRGRVLPGAPRVPAAALHVRSAPGSGARGSGGSRLAPGALACPTRRGAGARRGSLLRVAARDAHAGGGRGGARPPRAAPRAPRSRRRHRPARPLPDAQRALRPGPGRGRGAPAAPVGRGRPRVAGWARSPPRHGRPGRPASGDDERGRGLRGRRGGQPGAARGADGLRSPLAHGRGGPPRAAAGARDRGPLRVRPRRHA